LPQNKEQSLVLGIQCGQVGGMLDYSLKDQGLVLSAKIIRSEKFSKKSKKILKLTFLSERSEKLSSPSFGIANLFEDLKCS
jgi:hypothetical protein